MLKYSDCVKVLALIMQMSVPRGSVITELCEVRNVICCEIMWSGQKQHKSTFVARGLSCGRSPGIISTLLHQISPTHKGLLRLSAPLPNPAGNPRSLFPLTMSGRNEEVHKHILQFSVQTGLIGKTRTHCRHS